MSSDQLPNEEDIAKLLTSLIGDDVAVKLGESPLAADSATVRAFYVNGDGQPEKLLVCDLPFANGMGGALTMIPPATVKKANTAGEVPDNIYENFCEVLNICVNAFPAKSTNRVVLGDVIKPGQDQDIDNVEELVSFQVDIPKYGPGNVALAQIACNANAS